MWHSRVAAIGVILVCSVLTACAAAPHFDYHKLGVQDSRLVHDSRRCWAKTGGAPAADAGDAAQAVGTYLNSGMLGIALLLASRAADDAGPGSAYRRAAHGQCMEQLGYVASGYYPPAIEDSMPRRARRAGYRHRALPARRERRRRSEWPRRRWSQRRNAPRRQCYKFSECMHLCRKGRLTGYLPTFSFCRSTCSNDVPLCD